MSDTAFQNIDIKKKELRAYFRKLRADISEEYKIFLDHTLCDNIITLSEFSKAETVLFYFPFGSEPDLMPIVKVAMRQGKKVAFPVTNKESSKISFYTVNDLNNMKKGEYGIHEPNSSCPLTELSSDTLCIVPALAYDDFGNRLGYGGGYYDRFLSTFSGISLLAIYSFLHLEKLPTDIYDQKTDMIITEKGEVIIHEIHEQSKRQRKE